MITFCTDLIKAGTVQELEKIALDQAGKFFGPDYILELIEDYDVSHYGICDSRTGGYLKIKALKRHEMLCMPLNGAVRRSKGFCPEPSTSY